MTNEETRNMFRALADELPVNALLDGDGARALWCKIRAGTNGGIERYRSERSDWTAIAVTPFYRVLDWEIDES